MKKTLLFIILIAMPLLASAQTRFGYFSFDAMLKEMPEYVKAQADVDNLRRKYDSEMRRAEMEFNSKYEEFLEVQSTLVPTILRKRQTELQDLMEKNVEFRKDAERLLKQAETDAISPVRRRLAAAVAAVGKDQDYAFILNTDNDACPYINPEMGEDATELIKAQLTK